MNTISWSITSGKGGVGKTSLVCNLASTLAQRGERVLILDGDLGMANAHLFFGCRSDKSIYDVMNGNLRIEEILIRAAEGIDLISGGSGIYGLHNLDWAQKLDLLDQMNDLNEVYDYLLIDTAPGIDDNVLYLNSAAHEILVVLDPDPASLTDAYGLIKVLSLKKGEKKFRILVNRVEGEAEALRIYRRLNEVADRFLNVGLDYVGYIPFDLKMRQATFAQQLIVQLDPQAPSSQSIQQVIERMIPNQQVVEAKGSLQFFWRQLVGAAI